MVLTEDELSLIEFAKEYIYTFLSEFGDFLPFAVIMENGEVIPLEHEANDKSSSPTYLINMYENYFNQERNNNNEYQLGLLCIDIYTRSTMQNCKRSGIEYILFGINYTKRIIQHYKVLKDKSVLFDDMVGWDSGNSLG